MESTSESSILKRVKRHVVGRKNMFFAVTAPGLTNICLKELLSLDPEIEEVKGVKGGVEFYAKLHHMWLANLHLKTAGRILMRIGSFKATNFKQLEKKLTDFPWELYLYQGTVPKIFVTTRHSRLYHTDAISDIFELSIDGRLSSYHIPKEWEEGEDLDQSVFVRVLDDHFTVSMDSSGDALYKRGMKTHGGAAPIRETVAAAALLFAGYRGDEPLIDPMCGAGTFSLEGAMAAGNIPPGMHRDFAFFQWPSFRPKRWAHIKGEAEKNIILPEEPLIFASDKKASYCKALEKSVQERGLSKVIAVQSRDFFNFSPGELTDKKGLIALNPPYGKRLGTKKDTEKLYLRIGEKLKADYKGWKIILIAPDKSFAKKLPLKFSSFHFSHGGAGRTMLIRGGEKG